MTHLGDELSALVDGELSVDEAAAARAHLADCEFCTSELEATDRMRTLVRGLPMVDPPQAVPARAQRTPPLMPVAAAAAIIVLIALQWLPTERLVAPQVAGLGQTHASLIAASTPRPADGASAGSGVRPVVNQTTLAGFERVGTYRRGDVVHVLYSDGDRALSLFAEPGELEEDELPRGAKTLRAKGQTMWHWQRSDADVVVWESDGVVYTALGDAPVAEVLTAAASMPDEEMKLSMAGRMRRGCRALAELLTGG